MGGSPQPEPDSVPSDGRPAAQPLDPDDTDVIAGGGPSRRQLPRGLVIGLELVCGVAVLVWVGLVVANQYGGKAATEPPALTVVGNPEQSYAPGGAKLVVNLTNNSDAAIVIDFVTVLGDWDPEDLRATEWLRATVDPLNGDLPGGGAAVLAVTMDPPCGTPSLPTAAEVVVGWHTSSGHLGQVSIPDLLNTGPTSLGTMVRSACQLERHEPASEVAPNRRYLLSVAGVPFSFSIPTRGWVTYNDIYIGKSTSGHQRAEAIIYWTSFSGSVGGAHPCGQWWGEPLPTTAGSAARASSVDGTELVTGPSDVTVGGRAAKHFVFTIRKDVGCNPGFFYTWRAAQQGPFWASTEVGDTIRVWIVDVDGTLLFIEGDTHKGAGPEVKQEIQQIIESIQFE